jgi:Cu/Ag efflux protein CusF
MGFYEECSPLARCAPMTNPTQQEEYSMSTCRNVLRLPHASILAWALLIGMAPVLLPFGEAGAQGMPPMNQMPAMGGASQGTTGSGTGTVTAVNAANRKITFDHGPIPEIKWPAMKMEFPVAPSVDLSKVKTGDKVRFTLSGSGNSYTVQSITPSQ